MKNAPPYPFNALLDAAKNVVANWEKGDLALAVTQLDFAIDMVEASLEQEQPNG
jgi:hypothetical protein